MRDNFRSKTGSNQHPQAGVRAGFCPVAMTALAFGRTPAPFQEAAAPPQAWYERAWRGACVTLGLLIAVAFFGSGCRSVPSATGPNAFVPGQAGKKPTIPASVYLEKPVATINGVPLTVREYRWHLVASRAMVLRDVIARGDIPDPAHFWTTPIEGETPWETLREQALDHALEFRLEQMLAYEKGILADISYAAFRLRWNQENRLRTALIKQHRPAPGSRHFSEEEYYFFAQRQLEVALIRVLADGELAVTDEEVRRFYETNKERLYSRSTAQTGSPDDAFERLREVVRFNLIEEKYHAWLDDLLEKAVVVTDALALEEQKGLVTPNAGKK